MEEIRKANMNPGVVNMKPQGSLKYDLQDAGVDGFETVQCKDQNPDVHHKSAL